MDGWLSAAEELAAYEGIRLGDLDAFVALAEPLQPSLRRLAAVYVDDVVQAERIVRRSWRIALDGDAMFRWQTPLATWVAGITVSTGRNQARPPSTSLTSADVPGPGHHLAGPDDWSDLPWSARWGDVGARLDHALHALPVDEREVLHGHDLERWPVRRSCDVFGHPEAVHDRLLASARARVHTAIGRHVGAVADAGHRDAQVEALTRWLGRHVPHHPGRLDQATLAIYRTWAAGRGRRWRRLTRRGVAPPVSSRSVGPGGRRGAPASGTASAPPTPT